MIAFVLSFVAGSLQSFRNALSKEVSVGISPYSVTFLRFFFALPVVGIYIGILHLIGLELGVLTSSFWIFCLIIVFAQIIATSLLVYLFNLEFFTLSVTLSKIEAVFVAIIGMFFGSSLSLWGWGMVVLSIVGIVILTIPKLQQQEKFSLFSTLIGLLSGLFFAISTVCVAQAVSGISGGDLFLNVAVCLFIVLSIQSSILLIFLLLKNKKDIKILYEKKYKSIFLGVFGGLASICWFSAFCLINPALVKTIGSVEMVFTIVMGYVFFNDRLNLYEYLGMVVIILSSLGVLYA